MHLNPVDTFVNPRKLNAWCINKSSKALKMIYRTEDNFGGKKLWRIWRIIGKFAKVFFAKRFDCSLFHFASHDLA